MLFFAWLLAITKQSYNAEVQSVNQAEAGWVDCLIIVISNTNLLRGLDDMSPTFLNVSHCLNVQRDRTHRWHFKL